MALQGEYRWNFYGRWGAVGFGGLATVFEDSHMNVGLDFAVGDGDRGLYFRIGEAF